MGINEKLEVLDPFFHMKSKIPKISIFKPIDIIIPIYNGYEFLQKCLESLYKNTSIPYRLILIDDKSTDARVKLFLNEFKKRFDENSLVLIENKENFGFIKSVNKAASLVQNHFVILNTDTEVPSYWLERLIYPIIALNNIASVTPFTNSGTICSFPIFVRDNELISGLDVEKIDYYFKHVNFEKTYVEIPTGVGFCMAINKDVFDRIGLFDESFGKGFGEENDWCMKAKKLGYRNIIATNLFVYHKHGGSFSSQEKKLLIEKNLQLLYQRHPDYQNLVNSFIIQDPLKKLRTLIAWQIISDNITLFNPVIVLDHPLGGGANEFTNVLIERFNNVILFRHYYQANTNLIDFYKDGKYKASMQTDEISDIEKLIDHFKVQKIIINELVSYSKILDVLDYLINLKKEKIVEYIYYVHDFFSVCPIYTLLDFNLKYCDVPKDLNYCNECLRRNPIFMKINIYTAIQYPNLPITIWREKFGKLLEITDKIIFFSESSKKILLKSYPNLTTNKFELQPHKVSWVRKVNRIKAQNGIQNIAIIGNIYFHKGLKVVLDLATYIQKNQLKIKLHVFGDLDFPKKELYKFPAIIWHGVYQKEQLPDLMEENHIDIVLIPSICPETFSYTTEEAILMDLPVAVFNIGAPPIRVQNYDKGLILFKNDPENIVDSILNHLKKVRKEFKMTIKSEKENLKITICCIFSKDRPMQLDATIRSFKKYCKDLQNVHIEVLYKTSNTRYEKLYQRLIEEYPDVNFVKEKDFKNDLVTSVQRFPYILFVVDDTIFVREFSTTQIIDLLEKYQVSIGFSLRLGVNAIYCHPMDKFQRLPKFERINERVLKFNWTLSEYDFGYPIEVSSSMYRTKDLLPLLANLEYKNPNTFESVLDQNKAVFKNTKPILLCYEQSVAFSVPLNLVQTMWQNRASVDQKYAPENLANLFEQGYRFDIDKLDGFVPNACHQEVEIDFVKPTETKVPKVSVVITCYNLAQYLREAVESVVNQTFQDWECIIVDDGSTDDTKQVALELISRYPTRRIVYLHKKNEGVAKARNYGIQHSKGKYILPLDADDMLHPTFLEKTVRILDEYPYFFIVYTDLQEFGERNNLVQAKNWDPLTLPYQNHLNYCSLMRREVWEEVGGYNPNMVLGYEDWDFWIGSVQKGFTATRIPEPLFLYRIRNASRQTNAVTKDIEIKSQIILNHPNFYSENHIIWAEEVLKGNDDARNIPNQLEIIPWIIPVEFVQKFKKVKHKPIDFTTPLVSVVILTYNRPKFLSRAIKSVLYQTYQNFEIIVVNNAGADVSEIIKSFNDRRIKYFVNSKNTGETGRNLGIENSHGKYLAFLDDDDIFYPNHLEVLVDFLEKNLQYHVVYSDALRTNMERVGNWYQIVSRELTYSKDFDKTRLLFGNFIPINCLLFESKIIKKVGGFSDSLVALLDWDLLIRISRSYDFAHLKIVTCEFTIRNDTSQMQTKLSNEIILTQNLIYRKYKHFFLEDINEFILKEDFISAFATALECTKIFRNPSEYPEIYIYLGLLFLFKNQPNQANEMFAIVLHSFPQIQAKLTSLITKCVNEKYIPKLDDVVGLFREQELKKEIETTSTTYPKQTIEELMNNGKIDEAEKNILQFLKDNKDAINALNDLAIVKTLGGEFEEAKSILIAILAVDPENEIAKENLHVINSLQETK
ncbi:glycosyltransferase [Bacteroidetes/Chlorobi group bacterium Naka2016]|jgi:GT2 family glycosyltransferase|nr:MAG: glycosyltransferase [Bacteroidetes/Chlorobi group bacterium Naka2016]